MDQNNDDNHEPSLRTRRRITLVALVIMYGWAIFTIFWGGTDAGAYVLGWCIGILTIMLNNWCAGIETPDGVIAQMRSGSDH